MNRLGKAEQAGKEKIIVSTEAPAPVSSREAHRAGLGNDQTRPSFGPFGIISDGPIADRSLGVGKIIPHGSHDDAIPEMNAAERKGREDQRKRSHRSLTFPVFSRSGFQDN